MPSMPRLSSEITQHCEENLFAVGGSPEKRGAVAAASYEARAYGVYSATPSRTAKYKCPHLIFVPPRFEVYKQISVQIQEIFSQFTDRVEPVALDEAYLDVTENKVGIASAQQIAQEIRSHIFKTTQLTASAGVSVNKFLAKMASGINKPNGMAVILPHQAADFVETLPIEKFHGIGKVTAGKIEPIGRRLNDAYCETIRVEKAAIRQPALVQTPMEFRSEFATLTANEVGEMRSVSKQKDPTRTIER